MPQLTFSQIAQQIKQAVPVSAATKNKPEGKLRELVEPLWAQYVREQRINLRFEPRNERILANGRADTVFNRLIVEYKKPGVIRADNAKNRALISQVQGYIDDLAQAENWKHERLLGVAFDGNYFLYVRKTNRWVEEEPVPVMAESIEKFLLALEKLTSKAALIPENLIRDFAVGDESRNYVAASAIRAFYSALKDGVNERVRAFFEQWALQFAEVHGALENKKFDAATLFDRYGFKKQEQTNFDFKAFFFALDTYFGLLMKLLAYQVVGYYTLRDIAGLPLADWEKLDSVALQEKLADMEQGGVFRTLGIRNFLEGDLLSWYLNDWDKGVEQAVRTIIERLNQYDPETMELVPDETRDILKKLYQFLVPKQIRHDLGEYYTPDWLAERVLNQVGYGAKDRDLLKKRLLDPGCGSGTFVVLAIKRARENARLYNVEPAETLNLITRNIAGFDLNPIAVIAARTNYLLAVADLLKFKKGELTVPIYLCDSINPPRAKEQAELGDPDTGIHIIRTSVGNFRFPDTLVQRETITRATHLLEDSVKRGLDVNLFSTRAQAELKTQDKDNAVLSETYAQLIDLEHRGINGIWARIIRNAFAPLFMGEFDFVAGNPPWVNWRDLPLEYRAAMLPLNHTKYQLFPHRGLAARHGATNIDLSSLMFYVAADRYLAPNGKIGFLVTQTLFQSIGSKGFRRFSIAQSNVHLKVLQVDDMVALNPFDSAKNRTAALVVEKGQRTSYPVPYLVWRRIKGAKLTLDMRLPEALENTVRQQMQARPVSESDKQSNWILAKASAHNFLRKLRGKSDYTAHKGVDTSANAVFWVNVRTEEKGLVKIENFTKGAKREIPQTSALIEDGILYPLVRGKDVKRWIVNSSLHIIVPQDENRPQNGMGLHTLRQRFPRTFEYLGQFQKELEARKTFQKYLEPQGLPFYSLYDIKDYTFENFKVVWREIAAQIDATVISGLGGRLLIPDHKLVFVAFQNEIEAHYFCALLNSSPFRAFSRASAISTQNAPKILKEIRIPHYDTTISGHSDLSRLSKRCHEQVVKGIDVTDLEEQIDELAAELWGLTKDELAEIKASLEDMK